MGRVKDEAPAARAAGKPSAKGSAMKAARGQLAPFFANLARVGIYKPTQGVYARSWTGVALGALLLVGAYRLSTIMRGSPSLWERYGVPAAVALGLGWLVYRLLSYPPFADFLIATEAEMNKVSWTSRDDLKRATAVVLGTVALVSVFLFGVDWLWSNILQWFHILEFDGGGLGSNG